MAKNSQSSSSSSSKNQEKKKENRVCEKFFRAVTSPVRTVRRITTTSNNNNKTSPNHHHPTEPVHVKFSEPAKPIEPKKTVITRVNTTMKTDERFNDYIKRAKLRIRAMTNLGEMMNDDEEEETSETERVHHHGHHHHQHHHVPINRVSKEISGSNSERSDHFSDYIKKAKMKLRSYSTIARGNPTYDSYKD